jgi:hypothetical protein
VPVACSLCLGVAAAVFVDFLSVLGYVCFIVFFSLCRSLGGSVRGVIRAPPGFVHNEENRSNYDFTNHSGTCMNVRLCFCFQVDYRSAAIM